jgi:hypothetical protein
LQSNGATGQLPECKERQASSIYETQLTRKPISKSVENSPSRFPNPAVGVLQPPAAKYRPPSAILHLKHAGKKVATQCLKVRTSSAERRSSGKAAPEIQLHTAQLHFAHSQCQNEIFHFPQLTFKTDWLALNCMLTELTTMRTLISNLAVSSLHNYCRC